MIEKISLAAPQIGNEEIAAVTRALQSGQLSLGQEREKFELELANWVGAEYAVAVSSGTAALHLSVCASGITENDEVITTPFSFVASTNCILYERAKPVFIDIDEHSLTMDTKLLEYAITPQTKAILGVDIFGYPAQWQPLIDIAQQHRISIIDDAAEAIGAIYQQRKLGSLGHPTIFSFYPNKQMTTAEGGAILTNDKEFYQLAQSLSNQGRGKDLQHLSPAMLGFNYRMSELSAALGRIQLQRLDGFLAARSQVASWYQQRLAGAAGITLLKADDVNHQRSWFTFIIRLDPHHQRDQVIDRLGQAGIASKAYLPAIHLMPHLQKLGYCTGDFPICEAVAASTLALPFYAGMSEDVVDRVCNALLAAMA